MEHNAALFERSRDIQENQLVSSGFVVGPGDFDRVAGITDIDEIDTFDDAARANIEAGYDSFGQHSSLAHHPFRVVASIGPG